MTDSFDIEEYYERKQSVFITNYLIYDYAYVSINNNQVEIIFCDKRHTPEIFLFLAEDLGLGEPPHSLRSP